MGMIRVVEAIDNGNSADYALQVANMMTTIPIGMAMMKLQQAFTKILNEDVANITKASTSDPTNPSKRSAETQAAELVYKKDNTRMDSATSSYRSLFDTSKEQVTSDVEAQKNIVQIDNAIVSLQSTSANLVQRGASFGKQ